MCHISHESTFLQFQLRLSNAAKTLKNLAIVSFEGIKVRQRTGMSLNQGRTKRIGNRHVGKKITTFPLFSFKANSIPSHPEAL